MGDFLKILLGIKDLLMFNIPFGIVLLIIISTILVYQHRFNMAIKTFDSCIDDRRKQNNEYTKRIQHLENRLDKKFDNKSYGFKKTKKNNGGNKK